MPDFPQRPTLRVRTPDADDAQAIAAVFEAAVRDAWTFLGPTARPSEPGCAATACSVREACNWTSALRPRATSGLARAARSARPTREDIALDRAHARLIAWTQCRFGSNK